MTLMLSFDVKLGPLQFEIPNERRVIEIATERIKEELKSRLSRGFGADGQLPKPKDGTRPYVLSGQLMRSVGSVIRSRVSKKTGKTTWTGVVRAMGDRFDALERKASAKKRTAKMRAAFVLGESLSETITGKRSAHRSTKTGKIKVGSVKSRAAITNANLAGILSVPPKDKRARNGRRGVYRVFAKNNTYGDIIKKAAVRVGKFSFGAGGT